ncbi:MAG: LysM peptidoglycan-binding domain-containing protein [Candidatus Methylacidiphilaceae bacterium]
MKRKTRSSVRVLRWKPSGPSVGVAARSSVTPPDLVQQELPLKESTTGLRVITVMLGVMLLHVLFIGGIALYHLLAGDGKTARSEGGSQRGSVAGAASGSRPGGKPDAETGSPATSSSVASLLPRSEKDRKGGKNDFLPPSGGQDAGRKRETSRRLRRVSSKESAGRPSSPEMAPATGPGSVATVSTQYANEGAGPSPTAQGSSQIYHVIRGDTLWRIARRFHVGLSELMAVNHLSVSSKLQIGQELRIPPAGTGRSRRGAGATGG